MRNGIIALFSGSGIGLLIGVLLGLSVSPTVAVVIGVLASSLAILLGLNDSSFSNQKALRLGAFGYACVAGALFGIYVRTNNLMSPSLEKQKKIYTQIGYSEKEALEFISYKEFSIVNKDWVMKTQENPSNPDDTTAPEKSSYNESLVQKANTSVLFGSEIKRSECEDLEKARNEKDLRYFMNYFTTSGEIWKKIAANVKKDIDTNKQKEIILFVKDVLCKEKSTRTNSTEQAIVATANESMTAEEILKIYKNANGFWKRFALAVEVKVEKSYQKKTLLLVKKSLL